MRALTLTQPWAQLVALGEKRVETRSWTTRYRGPLAIHAAATLGPIGGTEGLVSLIRTEPFQSALRSHGIVSASQLTYGAIVAVCELVAVVPTGETWRFEIDDRERAFGDYTPGRYAWALDNVRALETPLPCKGKQGLWIPSDVEAVTWSFVDESGQLGDLIEARGA